ncbi:TAXI family TRAP transporter solute-binding subunit [Thermodesulfobacteriota bacterium]
MKDFTKFLGFGWLVSVAVIVSLAVCAPRAEAKDEWPRTINISGGAARTTYYRAAVVTANIISKYIEGVTATAVPTGGATGQVNLMLKGEAQMASLTTGVAWQGWSRTRKEYLPGGNKLLRQVMAVAAGYFHILVRADSDIHSIYDLKAKKVMCLSPESVSAQNNFKKILAAYNMTLKDIKAVPRATPSDQANALKERTADCIYRAGSVPMAYWLDLASSIPIRWISIDKEKLETINAPGYLYLKAPASKYPGIDKDVWALGFGTTISARTDLPDDLVYEITKAMLTHLDEIKAVHQMFAPMGLDFSVSLPVVPFHAGSIKYYREKGVWGSKIDKSNKKLLSVAGAKK